MNSAILNVSNCDGFNYLYDQARDACGLYEFTRASVAKRWVFILLACVERRMFVKFLGSMPKIKYPREFNSVNWLDSSFEQNQKIMMERLANTNSPLLDLKEPFIFENRWSGNSCQIIEPTRASFRVRQDQYKLLLQLKKDSGVSTWSEFFRVVSVISSRLKTDELRNLLTIHDPYLKGWSLILTKK